MRQDGLCCKCKQPRNNNYSSYCLPCLKAYRKPRGDGMRWYNANRERSKQIGQTSRAKLKREVMDHYGGVRACCGEKEIVFLAIDHIDNNGAAHRRQIAKPSGPRPGGGNNFYCWLKKNSFPVGYQVLCHNCNMAKHLLGRCPHQDRMAKSEAV